MFKNYIKTAFRGLLKNRAFTIINVLGLALGLAACLLIVFYVIDELSYDRYNAKADRIYRVNADIKFGGNSSSYAVTQPALAKTLMNNYPEVEKAVRLILAVDVSFKKGNENVHENKTAYADPDIFDVFTMPLIVGDSKTALTAPNSIVISEFAAKKYFNKTDVVGQYLTVVNDNTSYKITGVIKNIPVQSHFNFDYLLSMPSLASSRDNNWNNFSFSTYVLLKAGTNYKIFEGKLNALVQQHFGAENYKKFKKDGSYIRMNLTPLTDIHLQSNRQYELGTNNSLTYIYIFSAVALFVLLIACINFMNLSTARSANRAREVGVRKVLGSSRNGLVMQFLLESIFVTLFSTIIAGLFAWGLLPLFNQMSGKELTISFQMLAWLMPSLIIVIILVGVLAGSYPAFYLSSFQPITVLKGELSTGFKRGSFRSILVVLQFSISVFLIISSLVVYNQLNYIQNKNLGYNRFNVLVLKNINLMEEQSAKMLKQEVKQIPGVVDASLSGFLPTGSLRAPDAVFTNRLADSKNALFTEVWPVDEDYLSTMGMGLLKGRNFSKKISSDTLGVIINETAAKMLGFYNDPLNKTLYNPQGTTPKMREYHIIGVVKDFNFSSLRDNITPIIMKLAADKGALSIRMNAKALAPFITKIQNKWDTFSPNQHFEYSFMDEDFDAAYRYEQRTGKIFLSFTVLAIVIACLGLFSLAAYAAEQRNKEIGIRKVLGASVVAITTMLSKDFLKLVLISILIATPLAWLAMQQWLQGFAYRQNIQWWVLLATALGAVFIALITISFQSIKAAVANPVDSLRGE